MSTTSTATTPTPAAELLEREVFLDALHGYAAEAGSGHGRFVVVTGEPGIGKTSLVDGFRRAAPELRWLWGACDPGFTPRPLGPVLEIAQLLGGPVADLATGDADRHELFSSFVKALEDAPGTTGIVVEDVHWADEATLDWLSFLARRVGRCRVLVMVTCRDTGNEPEAQHRVALGQLMTHRSTCRMTLPPLSPESVRRLAGPSYEEPQRLFELTAGNPFYVVESLATADRTEVPGSVADVVAARIAHLSADSRSLLGAAAVLARPARPDLLAAIAGVPVSALGECLSSGTLVEDGLCYRFRHELTRLAVERTVPAYQRVELHRLSLLALEREGADHARLAHHAAGAGLADRALELGERAGDEAAAVASHREAVVQYRRALEFAGSADTPTRARLHEKAATELSLRDHWEESLVHREQALALQRQEGDVESVCRNLRAYSACLWRLCHGPESDAAIAEAYQLMADAPDSVERGWTLATYANFQGDLDVPRRLLPEALEVAERLDVPDLAGYVRMGLGALTYCEGGDGSVDLEKAVRGFQEVGDHVRVATAYTNLYDFAVDSLQHDAFAWVYDDALPWCVDHDIGTYQYCLGASHAQVLVRRAEHEQAIALTTALLGETLSPINRCHMLIPHSIARVRTGDLGGLDGLQEAWDLGSTSDAGWAAAAAIGLAQAAWLLDRPELVRQEHADALHDPLFQHVWIYAELATWLARLGRPTGVDPADLPEPWSLELAGRTGEAVAAWAARGCPFDRAVVLTCSGQPELMREAVEVFTTLGAPVAADRARRALRAAGQPVPAARTPRRSTQANPDGLTVREAEVLELLAEHLTNAQIADRLVLSTRTVDHHVSAVLTKLGVASRAEAAARHREAQPRQVLGPTWAASPMPSPPSDS